MHDVTFDKRTNNEFSSLKNRINNADLAWFDLVNAEAWQLHWQPALLHLFSSFGVIGNKIIMQI